MTTPSHLGRDGARLWEAITADFALDPREQAILTAACESADRAAEARAAIAADGAYIDGRFGVRSHPAIAVERDSRAAMLRSLTALGVSRHDAADLADVSTTTSFPRGRRAPRSVA